MSDDEDNAGSDEVMFQGDTILEGSVADGILLTAEPDPEGEWFTIAWHERKSVGFWTSREGEESIDLSLENAEKLLPSLADFVKKGKNATTSYWTGAIAANPKIAARGQVSSELNDRGDIILRTEHHALYIKPSELDDVIRVLVAAQMKMHGPPFHKKCGGIVTFRDEPSDVPGLLVQRCICANCGQLTDEQAYPEIDWP